MTYETVKEARKAAGFSQLKAAKILGISKYPLVLHENHGFDLPRGMRPAEAIAAIARAAEAKNKPPVPAGEGS